MATTMERLWSDTIQLYVTGACEMGCPHCSSFQQKMPDMLPETLAEILEVLKANGVTRRVELFANDPLLHPAIERMVGLLNESGLNYAILTVGASPRNANVKERFFRVLELVDPRKGAFVFSVDYTCETAEGILATAGAASPYAFKAQTFWQMAPILKDREIPVRVNIVVGKDNTEEVSPIIRRVAEMGFAISFCFIQHRQPEFEELLRHGMTLEFEQGFKSFLREFDLLSPHQIGDIIRQSREIIARGQLETGGLFNAFRGDDPSEADIEPERLVALRQELLGLKKEFGGNTILPSEEFIKAFGERGFGCLELLRQGQFPQLKIGPEGRIIFCCDLHDPETRTQRIWNLRDAGKIEAFAKTLRLNPYVWLCACFNPCSFSVNYVAYEARASFTPIKKKDLPLPPRKLTEVRDFCRAQLTEGNLEVLGKIPPILRTDWIDKRLPENVRANRHVSADPAEWRLALERMCVRTVTVCLRDGVDIALIMWRAALACNKYLALRGIRQCHLDVKRNETSLEIIELMPLNEDDRKAMRSLGGDGRVLIPDPMLASGSSAGWAIDFLKTSVGIRNDQLTIACVVAAPEGIYNILNQYPGVKIVAATMDGRLNANAYIVDDGLGDAGEKYFSGNAPENFVRSTFTDKQWKRLVRLLENGK